MAIEASSSSGVARRIRLGMVGGGQLARMSAAPAAALGIGFRVLAASENESAAQVVNDVFLGSHDCLDDLLGFARGLDVITFDHEHVPPAYLEQLEAMGVAVRPGPSALFHAQDKLHMRRALSEMVVAGIRTTLPLHQAVMDDPEFQSGDYTIHWLERFVAARQG